MMETLLLPGMDGTGELLSSFVRHVTSELRPRVVAYPRDAAMGYAELERDIPLPEDPFAIVADSFSGPLGIRLAARHPKRVQALVLVATFVRSPAPALARLAVFLAPLLFRRAPPAFALRWALMGTDATDGEIAQVRAVLGSVSGQVLTRRLQEVVAVDVSAELAAVSAPILYIGGARDRLVPPRALARMRALRPDMDVHVVEAPHFVLQRRPAETAALISRYLLARAPPPRS